MNLRLVLTLMPCTQFLIGDDLDSCLRALRSDERDNLHLLERTSFDLQVQNSIVPTAYTLARFKVSGHLPTLQVNMSDTKYKSLMRLIDVAIPHFDDETEPRAYAARRQPFAQRRASGAFKIPTGFFGASPEDYALESEEEDIQAVTLRSQTNQSEHEEDGDEFFETDPGTPTARFVPHAVTFRYNSNLSNRIPHSINMCLRLISRSTRFGHRYSSPLRMALRSPLVTLRSKASVSGLPWSSTS